MSEMTDKLIQAAEKALVALDKSYYAAWKKDTVSTFVSGNIPVLRLVAVIEYARAALAEAKQTVPDCADCHGTGRICVGHSGQADVGYMLKAGPLTEDWIDTKAQQNGWTANKAPEWLVELIRDVEAAHGIGVQQEVK